MNIPDNPSMTYIAFFLFVCGAFLVIAGLSIIKVEKVTVLPGFKTWGIGLILIFGAIFILRNPSYFGSESDQIQDKITKNQAVNNKNLLNNTDGKKANKIYTQGKVEKQRKVQAQREAQAQRETIEKEQAVNSLYKYYENLNNKKTNDAWGYFSNKFQIKVFKHASVTPSKKYNKWWLDEVERIEVVSLKYLKGSSTSTDAKIEGRLIYVLKGGGLCLDDHSIFSVVKINSIWLLSDKNKIKPYKRHKCI